MSAPRPGNEGDRLQALYRYEILDTLPEEAFDRITRHAADLFESQLAIINFVDRDRQWGKSCAGTGSTEAPRTLSFCAWTILEDEVLVIENAPADPRFRDNPMVGPPLNVYQYAGAPLRTVDGYTLGTLCVTHDRPRPFGKRDRENLRRLAAMVVDELDLRLKTRQLEQQAEHLAAINRELEAFSYSVSHDLQAPLRHIEGFSSLLAQQLGAGLDPRAARSLNIIQESVGRMNCLIEDLLRFSQASRQDLRATAVDLNRLVSAVRLELAPEAQGREVRWDVPRLPVVQGDRTLLHQVFVNLLGNALKYSRPRAQAVITVSVLETPREYVVQISDNGVGFDPQYQARLFGVFQRLHRADEFEGTGIGLALVRRIIDRHGGRTWAEAPQGHGATFCVALPRSWARVNLSRDSVSSL